MLHGRMALWLCAVGACCQASTPIAEWLILVTMLVFFIEEVKRQAAHGWHCEVLCKMLNDKI